MNSEIVREGVCDGILDAEEGALNQGLRPTLRDRFAIAALQGMLAHGIEVESEAAWLEVAPRAAYAMADAMLTEREKKAVDRG